MNKWLLAAVVAVALAPLALMPAFASSHGKSEWTNVQYSVGNDCGAAQWIAQRYMWPYHGGWLRGNCLAYYGGGDWLLGVRAQDGALLYARVVGPTYSVHYYHQ